MIITNELREKTYFEADGVTRELYAGDITGSTLLKIFESYHLRPELYHEYVLTFGDVILGLIPREQLSQAFTTQAGISEKVAPLLAKELIDFLESELGRGSTSSPTPPATTPPETPTNVRPQEPTPAVPRPPQMGLPPKAPAPAQWSSLERTPPAPEPPDAPTDERPFYARTPNYAKPFTAPSTPAAPSVTPPRPPAPPNTPPAPSQPRANDPYHEPI